MSPIRVGIIGLSTSATTDWAPRAHLPALLAAKDNYTIAAVCNTSVASAERAIATYKLAPSTKAYGNAQDLADDPNVRKLFKRYMTRNAFDRLKSASTKLTRW